MLREGEIRYTSGTAATKYQYTGQYAYESLGLDYYVVRFYDPALGRFISADTVVPGGVQGYDRYAYANNNPILYNDPSGHSSCAGAHAEDGPDCAKREGTELNTEIKILKYMNQCARHEYDCLGPKPDAHYASLTISAGAGPWYAAWSFDIVANGREVGYFSVSSLGPGFQGDKYFASFQGLSGYKATFMTPQIGASVFGGSVWGGDLRPENGGVQNYSGPALVVGGGAGTTAVEHVTSMNSETGIMITTL